MPRWPFLAAGLALGLVAGTVTAGTVAGEVGVSLRITGSCEVDSAAGAALRPGTAPRLPQVRCALPTPRTVSVTREPQAQALPQGLAGPEQGDVRVVTLTF